MVSSARFGGALDYVGPNLTSSQLIVYPPGHDNPNGPPPTASQLAATGTTAQHIAASLDDRYMITLETPSGSLQYGGPGRGWSGITYVATPQLLNAFGITPAQVNPDADFLTMRPGLSTTQHMQLWDTRKVSPGTPCTAGQLPGQPADPGDQRAPFGHLGAEHGDHRARHAGRSGSPRPRPAG